MAKRSQAPSAAMTRREVHVLTLTKAKRKN
jgi:hypothetical protein